MGDFLIINTGTVPFLISLVVFLPLAGALVLLFVNNEDFARLWTLAVTVLVAFWSIPLYMGFDPTTAKYQFVEHHAWIPA
jgi:NADH-quinone oxidoreductase subunit M